MNKLLPKKPWHYLVLCAIVLSAALGIFFRSSLFPSPKQPVTLNAMLQQIRSAPETWKATEGDVSMLILDMQKNNVAGAAVAPSGIFVTAKSGKKYFIADGSGRFASLALSQYHKNDTDAFPLAVLDKDVEGPYNWRADVGLLLTLSLLGVLLLQGFRMTGGGFKFSKTEKPVTFDDVIGANEAKAALRDIKTYLKDAKAFAELGAKPPKGVLLSGPPGTGKTQLAKALAGECGVNFIAATGGDFSAMFLGVGSSRVKALFKKARKNAPCIVFLDEIDGIGRRTNTENGGPAESEGNRIINQILAEMDGFSSSSGVIVIGATNYPDAVDPALLREGRFDRKIQVSLPDVAERAELFRLYTKKLKAVADLDFAQLGRLTTGLTPAAIAYVANHAALITARNEEKEISMRNFVEAIEVCRMGEKNGSGSALTEAERERIAVHEAGHAIMAQVLGCGQVEKVTILSRGQALGVTLVTQKEDKHLHLKSELEHRIQMLLGGRAAELITYDDASSGASSDLKEASRLALSMVATLGLGDNGTLFSLEALAALNIAPDTKIVVAEAEAVLTTQNERCLETLRKLEGALKQLTAQLLEHETIDGAEVARIVAEAQAEHGERRRTDSPMRSLPAMVPGLAQEATQQAA
ncbi:AAA family ATPase [Uliginosibacterium sp. H3]|uniref:AAA family ATPase n=1 Tax=Uliginosibacterium silvisoli TaxID=3114758 RepID=A0ABU6K8A9_9RHOO|nr:AAA family ATPase [Uliginosibacterium sp. H3]